MWIIGCDYLARFQQIALVSQETGECENRRPDHKSGEVERFYHSLAGQQVRVGMEATGGMRWFERLLGELGFELWVGDPVKVRAAAQGKPRRTRKTRNFCCAWLLEKRFPRIWVPTMEQRDARHLVLHRHRLVQTRTRARISCKPSLAMKDYLHNDGYGPRRAKPS